MWIKTRMFCSSIFNKILYQWTVTMLYVYAAPSALHCKNTHKPNHLLCHNNDAFRTQPEFILRAIQAVTMLSDIRLHLYLNERVYYEYEF